MLFWLSLDNSRRLCAATEEATFKLFLKRKKKFQFALQQTTLLKEREREGENEKYLTPELKRNWCGDDLVACVQTNLINYSNLGGGRN